MFFDGLRAHQSFVVDDGGHEVIRDLRRHDDTTAIGNQRAGIAHAGDVGQRCFVDGEIHQAIAFDVQRQCIAGDQCNGAGARADDAGVVDEITGQQYIAARSCGDVAVVDDIAVCARVFRARQREIAGHEIVRVHVQRGGEQALHVHGCTRREEHALRIQQEYLAVRQYLSEDLARIAADDAVQHNCAGIRLVEDHVFIGSHIEGPPIDGGALGDLVDMRGDTVRARDDGFATHHHFAGRAGQCNAGHAEQCERGFRLAQDVANGIGQCVFSEGWCECMM